MKKLLLYLTIFIRLTTNVFSQDYSFKLYGAKEGLETPDINCVFQDSRGYLWVGGINGLNKFDGSSFINFNKLDGLPDNDVIGIREDKNNNLWISTLSGVALFDGSNFTKFKISLKDSLSKIFFFQNAIETSKGLTYAYGGKGLFLCDLQKKRFTKVSEFNYNVRDVIEDKNGVLWIATENGLYNFKNNIFLKIELDTIPIKYSLTCLNIDKEGVIWIGSTNGILKYDGTTTKKYFVSKNAQSVIRDVIIDNNGQVIFTSDAPELKIYNKGIFKIIDISYLINRANVLRINQDRNGNYWLASTAGLIKMYSKPFSKYYLSDSIKAPVISITNKSDMIFGTLQGLVLNAKGKLKKCIPSNNPDEQYITSLLQTDSCLFVGTYSGQVFKFEDDKFMPFGGIDYNSANPVYQMLSTQGQLWICKGFNVVNCTNGKFSIHDFSKLTASSANISSFTQSALTDSKGIIWFAHATTFTKYENGKFIEVGEKDGFKYEGAATLCEDLNQNIWIGTYGNGLVKYDRKSYKNFTVKDGLISNYISSALYDKKRNTLWIGTINGISKLTLDANADISSISNYNQEQGLESAECNQNAVFQLPNGNILFGTSNGVYEYNQSFSNKIKPAPQLNFTGLRLNYDTVNWTGVGNMVNQWSKMPVRLTLPYHKNHLTFDFIGLNIDAPENVRYQWMLEGFDADWNPKSKNLSVTYSNLPANKYTFKVRACNANGIWSEPVSYSFVITPPFYKTWWFILLVVLVVFGCIYLFIITRINKIKIEEEIKTENYKKLAEVELKAMRAQMNPHFMFNTLNSIQDIVLNKDDETARIYLADFSSMMRMILENSTQKLITLEKEIEFIKLYLKLEQLRFEDKFIDILVADDELNKNTIKLPPMLIQPFVENAIVHGLMHKTENGRLIITFQYSADKQHLGCIIIDNGIGRKKAAELSQWKTPKHKSLGIEITTDRIQILNSLDANKTYTVTITDLIDNNSIPNGTQVVIHIPLQ